jgi:C4-dicarboxylate-specific signal transduction histidine kinase
MANYLSLLPTPLPGFRAGPIGKRELLGAPIALVTPDLELALSLLPEFRERVEGVLITIGLPAYTRIGPMLWHWSVQAELLLSLLPLLAPTLEAIAAAGEFRETSIRENLVLSRLARDLELYRQDYLRVTGKLEEKVHRLQETEQELRHNQQGLAEANEQLEARVEKRTAELEAANRQLTQTIDQLQLAKDEIVRTEKLAALGSIVAGLSHELNTPIGNSLMSASSLQDDARKLLEAVDSGLRRSQLTRFLDDTKVHCELLMRNLTKANDLIAGFKQVAVDQTSSQRRRFELAATIADIVMTLRPSIGNARHKLEADIAPELIFDSYPGPLGQVVINLVHNALMHAFEGRPEGHLSIHAQEDEPGTVTLVFADDGVGIPAEHLNRIFDPFFTTKMGQGGTGLGLNIVHSIVTGILGGSIAVASAPGEGTTFTLRLPRVAPTRNAETSPESAFPMFGSGC